MKTISRINPFTFALFFGALLLSTQDTALGEFHEVPNKEAASNNVKIFHDIRTKMLEFRSTNPDKVTHIRFRLYSSTYKAVPGGTEQTKSTTREQFELDIPPMGATQFSLKDKPTSIKIEHISRLDPPKSALPPKP